MKQNRITALCILLSAALCSGILTSCRDDSKAPSAEQTTTEAAVTTTVTAVTTEQTTTEETTTSAEPEQESRFTFQPMVCSDFMREVFGETKCEVWSNLVDAMMAGKDTFACPDEDTYGWVMGQFPNHCFPVADGLVETITGDEPAVRDGIAQFRYTVSQEEFQSRVREFAEEVEEILNETMKPDYSDFEKAFVLYQYFAENYWYDYDALNDMKTDITTMRKLSSGHIFSDKTGICCELSTAYSYLLMQAGVNATVMMGADHEWSYVEINGKNYHIDPTFALSGQRLVYFLMDDQQREYTGCGPRKDFIVTSCYAQFNKVPDYKADDDTFSELWDDEYVSLDHEKQCLTVRPFVFGSDAVQEPYQYSYAGY